MQKYTISELERKYGYSNSKIRRLIKKRLLPITKEKRENKDITIVLVEDEKKLKELFGDHDYHYEHQDDNQADERLNQFPRETFQDVEIIKETSDYQLISMEQKSFDQLIQSIKELADDRTKADRESYKKLEDQYFLILQDNKLLAEKVENYKIESIQAQAESKIKELKINELEAVINQLKKELETHKIELIEFKTINSELIKQEKELREKIIQQNKTLDDLQEEINKSSKTWLNKVFR